MKVDFHALANHTIRNLMPYQPGKPISELQRELNIANAIKLGSNENQLGASPCAIEAVAAALSNAHYYPDCHCYDLKQSLASHFSINPDQLTIGNGSEQILELVVRSYLRAGDRAVLSEYAFMVIPTLLQAYGVEAKPVAAANFGHDIYKMIKAIDDKTRVLFLVNPNNPTGTYIPEQDFIELMESVPQQVLVVVDEAYAEYLLKPDYPNTIKYLPQYPNLVITRTFSKVYGLAGLRIGYGIASPVITDILNRARPTFSVNTFAEIAAKAALSDQEHVKRSVLLNQEGLQQIEHELHALGIPYIPSVGNFITLEVGDGISFYEKLCREGIIVRPLSPYNLPHHIRVTVGTYEQNELFLNTLKKLKYQMNETISEELTV